MRINKGCLTVKDIDIVTVEFSPGGVGLRLDGMPKLTDCRDARMLALRP